jgi:hypothetical protein
MGFRGRADGEDFWRTEPVELNGEHDDPSDLADIGGLEMS